MENIDNNLKFTEVENKIRKRWLFWLTIPSAVIFGFLIIAGINVFSSDFKLMIAIFLISFIAVGGWYMHYYCAYKNPGTTLLLFDMIGIVFNLITLFNPESLDFMKVSPVFSLFILTILFYQVIVFYYSYKLRKINKNMKQRKLKASPAYINAFSVFSTANSLEELNQQFMKLKASNVSGSSAPVLALAYDQQKKTLQLANS